MPGILLNVSILKTKTPGEALKENAVKDIYYIGRFCENHPLVFYQLFKRRNLSFSITAL